MGTVFLYLGFWLLQVHGSMYRVVAEVPGAWTQLICKRWKLLIHFNLPLCGIAREGVLEYAR
jgi:hypothetical protein